MRLVLQAMGDYPRRLNDGMKKKTSPRKLNPDHWQVHRMDSFIHDKWWNLSTFPSEYTYVPKSPVPNDMHDPLQWFALLPEARLIRRSRSVSIINPHRSEREKAKDLWSRKIKIRTHSDATRLRNETLGTKSKTTELQNPRGGREKTYLPGPPPPPSAPRTPERISTRVAAAGTPPTVPRPPHPHRSYSERIQAMSTAESKPNGARINDPLECRPSIGRQIPTQLLFPVEAQSPAPLPPSTMGRAREESEGSSKPPSSPTAIVIAEGTGGRQRKSALIPPLSGPNGGPTPTSPSIIPRTSICTRARSLLPLLITEMSFSPFSGFLLYTTYSRSSPLQAAARKRAAAVAPPGRSRRRLSHTAGERRRRRDPPNHGNAPPPFSGFLLYDLLTLFSASGGGEEEGRSGGATGEISPLMTSHGGGGGSGGTPPREPAGGRRHHQSDFEVGGSQIRPEPDSNRLRLLTRPDPLTVGI